MLFDTHCHLNFEAFNGRVERVISEAKKVGVNQIVIPGTDFETSKKAIKIAEKYEGIYAAVGIHPHHVFEIYSESSIPKFFIGKQQTEKNLISSLSKIQKQKSLHNLNIKKFSFASDLDKIKNLLKNKKVVAIGEVGIDRHIYQKTKYPDYKIEEEFVDLQKKFFLEQVKLAYKYKKGLIIHNREAKKEVLDILTTNYQLLTTHSAVFHCCEPDPELLEFAKKHRMFIGVDGDITYYKEKQDFIKTVPLEMLVLETDSPFLTPRLRLAKGETSARQNNEPKNIPLIAEFAAKLKDVSINRLIETTTENARRLFKI